LLELEKERNTLLLENEFKENAKREEVAVDKRRAVLMEKRISANNSSIGAVAKRRMVGEFEVLSALIKQKENELQTLMGAQRGKLQELNAKIDGIKSQLSYFEQALNNSKVIADADGLFIKDANSGLSTDALDEGVVLNPNSIIGKIASPLSFVVQVKLAEHERQRVIKNGTTHIYFKGRWVETSLLNIEFINPNGWSVKKGYFSVELNLPDELKDKMSIYESVIVRFSSDTSGKIAVPMQSVNKNQDGDFVLTGEKFVPVKVIQSAFPFFIIESNQIKIGDKIKLNASDGIGEKI